MELRYMGFEQAQNIRRYKFDGIAHGRATEHFVVTANLVLFQRHQVGIQEGPSLCLHRLSADLEELGHSRHELTEHDLLAYVTARTNARARKTGPRNLRRSQKTAATATAPEQ
ncbi:MAG: hypothetical protein WD696_20880 [Bryobacteraceae bacterium]